jgi:ABC-type glycerol-3-phosphate transport system permease component
MIQKKSQTIIIIAVLVLLALVTLYPFLFTIMGSLKSSYQMSHNFWGFPYPMRFVNFVDAWKQLNQYFLSSFIVTISSVIGVLLVSSWTAFVFARFPFPGKEFLFLMIIALMMVPGILVLVPQFILVKGLGLLNTRWALLLPYISGGQVFAIFIIRSFIEGIPASLFEAVKMDGGNSFFSYRYVAIPLSKPILSTVAILNILATWNDYVWPLVTISKEKIMTLTVGLMQFTGATSGFELRGAMFAGYVLGSIPLLILFFFTMRSFVSGLSSGAVKI